MKIVLATSNKGKIKEIKELFQDDDVIAYSDIIEEFDIEENGKTFKENALIKARAVHQRLKNKNYIVLSDDSGISVDALDGKPGIYSARFAKIGANDKQNRAKLIESLRQKNISSSSAFYTAAIAAITPNGEFTAHGYCYGKVVDFEKGENGFGYDFLFIPKGYDKTLGELPKSIKQELSHRVKAIKLIKKVL